MMATSLGTEDLVSDTELRVRRILRAYAPQGTMTVAIRLVFEAMWWASLPVPRILKIAEALSGSAIPEDALRAELARMVRAAALRSRVSAGVRLWEVNL